MSLQWWCAASDAAWSWQIRPYVGVWLFVLAVLFIYRAVAWGGTRFRSGLRWYRLAALLLLWVTLDWPVGALGAGYLVSVHAMQFIMLAMVLPVLFYAGADKATVERLGRNRTFSRVIGFVTFPPVAILIFEVAMAVTHAVPVLDTLRATQAGSFVLDMTWFVAGLIFAWPLFFDVPPRPRFNPFLRILYVILGTMGHVFIAMWLLVTQYPVYATYELAPRIAEGAISALSDQQLAGAVMLLIGSPLVIIAITVIFFRWQGSGEVPEKA